MPSRKFYDTLASQLLEQAEAQAVCVVVLDGVAGTAASLKIDTENMSEVPGMLAKLALELRQLATQIEDGKFRV